MRQLFLEGMSAGRPTPARSNETADYHAHKPAQGNTELPKSCAKHIEDFWMAGWKARIPNVY